MSTSVDQDQLIESIRKEPDVMQKVRLLVKLTSSEIKIKDIADKLGVQSSYVCHLLRLKRVPDVILDGFYANNISLSHLFIISRIKNQDRMIQTYEKVLAESLTVKGTEEAVREVLYGLRTEGEYLNPEEKVNYIQKIAGNNKNYEIKIIQTRIKSKIVLEIKGSLDRTSKEVRDLLKRLEIKNNL